MRKLIHWIKKKFALYNLHNLYRKTEWAMNTLTKYQHEQKVYCNTYGLQHPACALYTFKTDKAWNTTKTLLRQTLKACNSILKHYNLTHKEKQNVQYIKALTQTLLQYMKYKP